MVQPVKAICVFCGSSYGHHHVFKESAHELGKFLAEQQIQLVFGGSNVGLMGEVSQSVVNHGGKAIGIIPRKIFENVDLHELTEIDIVETMHERKAKMHELADAFIAMPGGIGTLEELAETMTWSQIGYHQKPMGILNTNQFYEPFLHLLKHMSREGFYNDRYLNNLVVESSPRDLLEKLKTHKPISVNKWQKD